MPKITIIKIIHFTIDFLLAGFHLWNKMLSDFSANTICNYYYTDIFQIITNTSASDFKKNENIRKIDIKKR